MDEIMKRYTVTVTREDGHLLAEIANLRGAHTYAGNILSLEDSVREVIALIEDLPAGAEQQLNLDWNFDALGPLAAEAHTLHLERARVQVAVDELARKTRTTIRALVEEGWSTRDVAGLVGTSPGRVSQIVHEADRVAS